ncbi:hypothetical protein [Mesorhizobium sp. f-mel]
MVDPQGQRVLIHGGAGDVGHQAAKAAGAFVVTTVAAEDFDFAREDAHVVAWIV